MKPELRDRPEWPAQTIAPPSMAVLLRLADALNANLSAVQQAFAVTSRTPEGSYWNHFAPGDRVLVFGEPDPVHGRRRVRRGTVLDPLSPDMIRMDFGDEGCGEFSPADPIRVSHAAGACRCVVAIS